MAQKGTSFDDVNTGGGGDKIKVTDVITPFKFPERKWVTLRPYGPIHCYATYWVKAKKKDGKPTKFPVDSPSWNAAEQSYDSSKYDPWHDLWVAQKDVERDDQLVQISQKFWVNMLSRGAQRQQPRTLPKPTAAERKSGFKDKDSDSWTAWVPVGLPKSAIKKIKELKGLNNVTSKKTGNTVPYSVDHEKYGCDIQIMFDPDKSPAEQYQVQLGKRRALTEEELAMLRWDTSGLAQPLTDEKQIRRDYEEWAKRMGLKVKKGKVADPDDLEEDEDFDDEDEAPKSKKSTKKPAAKKSAKKPVDEDDDFDDEDDAPFDDDEDEDDAPKSKKSTKAKSKRVADDEEDDEDEDDGFDDDDEEEDEAPAKSKKKPAAKSAKSKKSAAKDEDEDDDDFGDDDDSDDEDSDDDFGDDDDEDEDEAPKSKKSTKKPAAKAGKKKPVDDDEDEDDDDSDLDDDEDDEDDDSDSDGDDDDDFDDDEDEEDEPPAKSTKKPAAKKPVAKKRK